MTEAHALKSPTPIHARPRKIVRRTRGRRHGPLTRLMSPSDLGQVLKPDPARLAGPAVSPSTGRIRVPESVEAGELAIFELGQYSVHSSAAMLRAGEQRLKEIQRRLQNDGRL